MPPSASELDPADRRQQIVHLLALGLLRYHRCIRPLGGNDHHSAPNSQNPLALSADSRLHGDTTGAPSPAGEAETFERPTHAR